MMHRFKNCYAQCMGGVTLTKKFAVDIEKEQLFNGQKKIFSNQ